MLSSSGGRQGDRGGIIVSGSFLDRDEIHVGDNYGRYGGTSVSGTGQPGRLIALETPVWGPSNTAGFAPGTPVADGALPRARDGSSFGQADVNCNDSAALEQAGPLGTLGPNLCIYDYGPFFAIQAEEKLRKLYTRGYYDLTDQVEFYFELASNESEFNRLNSLNPNAPALPIPDEVTYFDEDGNPQIALNPGSQEDAFRRGIEPITYANVTRLIGGTRDTPREYRPVDTFTNTDRKDSRYVAGLDWDFEMGDRQWNMNLSYTASNHNSSTTQVQDTLSTHMELALSGLGGPNCDVVNGTPGSGNASYVTSGGDFDAGNCYFFNPFGNSQFDREGNLIDIDGLAAGDPTLARINAPELYTWLLGKASSAVEYKQRVIDWVFAGDIFDLGNQPVGLAFGYQQRRDKGETYVDSALTSDNLDFVFGARPWSGSLTTNAFFAEIGIPIGDRFTANFAVRHEDFDEIDEKTTDPKVSLLWQPLDSLSLRGSWGTSFRVPSLQQSFGTLTTVGNRQDVSTESTFKPSITVGNPDLVPESAENWNIGVSWAPVEGFLEGFQIDLDWFDYKYEDIITREPSQVLVDADNAVLRQYAVDNGCSDAASPTAPAGSSNNCRPQWIEAVDMGLGNREQVIRNDQAILLRVLPDFANANGADVRGMDINTSYTFDSGIGNWRLGLQAAWMERYDVENASGVVSEGVGSYNQNNAVARPLPEWRVNGTLNWNFNNHSAFLIVKYVDSLITDVPSATTGFFAATARLAGNDDVADDLSQQASDGKIPSMTTADIQYTYTFGELGILRNSAISLGIMNFTNEEAPAIGVVTAYDGTLHDGRGRMWFLRLRGSM